MRKRGALQQGEASPFVELRFCCVTRYGVAFAPRARILYTPVSEFIRKISFFFATLFL